MTIATEWREQLMAYIREQALPVEKFSHQPRLYVLTREVGEGSAYDDDVVFAAVWLHDLGVFLGHRPEDVESLMRWDNTAYAMSQAPMLLERFGFPTEKIGAVVEVIRTHQPKDAPTTIEGVILRDADILEQLGATAVMRTVCKIGRDTRYHTFTDAYANMRKALELPQKLQLEAAKRLAEPRVATLTMFLHALQEETGEHMG